MNYLKTLWGLIMKNNFQKLLSKEYTIEDETRRIIKAKSENLKWTGFKSIFK